MSSECCLEEVFRKCPHLEVVDLCGVQTVTNRTIFVLLEYCSKLRHLFLLGCHQVDSESLLCAESHGVAVDIKQRNVEMQTGAVIRRLKVIGQI